MDMQGALRARLTNAAAVTNHVGQRIYWIDRPQAQALPAITLQIISDGRPQHLKGFHEIRDTRVQIDVWSLTYATNKTITEAVIATLVPEDTSNAIRFNRSLVEGVRDLGESTGTQFIHRTSLDLIVWWSLA